MESVPSDEGLIDYFNREYSHEEILSLLLRLHNVKISKRTLKIRLKSYGLRRRRAVWHTLCLQGIRVPKTA